MSFWVREIVWDEGEIINVGVKVRLVTGVVERSWFAQVRCPASLLVWKIPHWCFSCGASTELTRLRSSFYESLPLCGSTPVSVGVVERSLSPWCFSFPAGLAVTFEFVSVLMCVVWLPSSHTRHGVRTLTLLTSTFPTHGNLHWPWVEADEYELMNVKLL